MKLSLLCPSFPSLIIVFYFLLILSAMAMQFSQVSSARKLMRVALSPPPSPSMAKQLIFAVL
ncbi:hypothetical protein TIFTF001_019076 [Ficus carica]|uniref:Uncharacterized protein n=1 Tax=Ficus carica TaxID=3494 RepID=A0AA88DCA5_FICCA|nr:hypothetical protein TIFTF001_019076 [Ficus carica]